MKRKDYEIDDFELSNDSVATPRKKRKAGRIVGYIFLGLLITSIGLGGYVALNLGQAKAHPEKYIPTLDNKDIPSVWTDVPGFEGQSYNKNLRTVLIIGADNNAERDEKRMGYRSDVMMVLSIDVKSHKVSMLSIPRDTLADVNKLDKNGKVYDTVYTKINTAFAYGHGIKKYSGQNTMDAISKLIDIPIVNYIAMNMDSVAPLADAVNGVPITIDADFSKFGMPKGSHQVLKGSKVLTYIRERHLPGTDGSDIMRTKRQLHFMEAYAERLKSLNPLTVLVKNYSILKNNTHTNLSYDQLYALAQFIQAADLESAYKVSLPGSGNGKGAWVADRKELTKIRNEMFFQK